MSNASVEPVDQPAERPTPAQSPTQSQVTFRLPVVDGWPPCSTETVAAVLVGPEAARIVGVPGLVDDVSVGDVVSVEPHDDLGLLAGVVTWRSRHSTIRVVSAEPAGLAEVTELMASLGLCTVTTSNPAVLAVDVPDRVAIEEVLVLLDLRCSLTLTYTVSCLRHRITPLAPNDLRSKRNELAELAGPTTAEETVHALEAEIRGLVAQPGDAGWDAARAAWNLAVDQRPARVVEVSDVFDVQAVVRYAARHDLRVAPQGTGHNAAPLGDLGDAILLRTGRMNSVDVDVDARSVRVGSGAIWGAVTAALEPHGLAALAGSAPDVGVAGYALGGGYSWLGRRHGLASSSITAIEMITGDGSFHRVDADNEPELFWSVRGGGANIGVVCAIELDVLPIPEVIAGAMLFPLDRAREILTAYAAWTADLDEAATTCIRLIRIPPMPEVPEPLRGNAFVIVDGAIEAGLEAAGRLLAPLRALGPVMDTFAPMPTGQLGLIHMDPPGPVPAVGDGLSLAELTPEVIDVLVAHAGPGVDSALLTVDLRQLGGALGRPDPRGGVVDHLDGGFLVYAVGIAGTPEAGAAVGAEVAALIRDLTPWAAERDYLNFREVAVPPGRLYPAADLNRLLAVRDSHDPQGVLVSAHAIG